MVLSNPDQQLSNPLVGIQESVWRWFLHLKDIISLLVMPDTLSVERRKLFQAYGAEMVLTPGSGGMKSAIAKAKEIVTSTPGAFMPNQFENPANPEIHRKTTALEILNQVPHLDAFVAGVGTGGTITGVGEVLKTKLPHVEIVAVEPAESPILSGGEPGKHKIQGMGAGFIPPVLNDDLMTVLSGRERTSSTRWHGNWHEERVCCWYFFRCCSGCRYRGGNTVR